MHKIVDLRFDDYFAYAPNVGTRGNNLKLYPFFAGRNVAFNFFGNRVVNYWNSLPDYVDTAASLNIFKNSLDEKVHLLHRFLRGLSEFYKIFCPWVNLVVQFPLITLYCRNLVQLCDNC